MANANKYLTSDDAHLIECDIYNDRFVWDEHFINTGVTRLKVDFKSNINLLLQEGEQYYLFTNNRGYDYIYTNYGRLISLKTCKMQKPMFSSKALNFSVACIPINSIKYHEMNGWEHNVREIWYRYMKNQWAVRDGSYKFKN